MTVVSDFIDTLGKFEEVFPYINVEYKDNFWFLDDDEGYLSVDPVSYDESDELEWNYGFEAKDGCVRAEGYLIINLEDGSGGDFTMILNEAKEIKEIV